ncbi:hypothetical protein ZYGR_0N06640 [Zygosaccharomyces rouxii]|uniref:ZYRO0D15554p n=2 Tax=Zygosaccharomyces rouxii TaxID=4956 RepID=C5DWK4_ZYGRC|nr:uncharacterized protein ZYRO0D15554g [Zygosaccharomyces rouxii]KAH9201083.1 aspartic peptidase domain-containing protein [Zygosaccharomyces rouxii]GAV49257.1 hypothetical protein ZYGR_0N06640 [Zygosaccharomyces rouxii]CAR28173.1 ZYRO0D15554p [Zygosaccharomyces rouxii]
MFNVLTIIFLSLACAFPLVKKDGSNNGGDGNSGTLMLSLKHVSDEFYSTTLEIGSPAQKLDLVVDSGSADTWVMASTNPFCSSNAKSGASKNYTYNGKAITETIDCQGLTALDVNSSSQFRDLNVGRFYINYTDGSFDDGYWATDEVSAAGAHISGLQFGVAQYASEEIPGILGLGFPRRESVRGYPGAPNKFYDNFPQMLKKDGIIDVVAYSMYLNDPNGSGGGSVLFGGVDPSKYSGDLYTFPMANQYPNIVSKPATLAVTLQGFGAQKKSEGRQETFDTNNYAVLLDSGTSLMGAPEEVVSKMAHFINKNARFSEDDGIYVMDCPPKDDDTEFVFDFGDLQIAVPVSTLILPPSGESYCGLGVLPKDGTWTLGDVFLSYAYLVFDLDNYKVSMAKAKFSGDGDQSPQIKIQTDGTIPGAKSASAKPWSSSEPSTVSGSIFTKSSNVSLPHSSNYTFCSDSTATGILKATKGTNSSQSISSTSSNFSIGSSSRNSIYTQTLTKSAHATTMVTSIACNTH